MSVFDRLQKQLDIKKREQGISALEIADLPPNLRLVMRRMLREVVLRYTELCAWIETLPERRSISQDELDAALEELVKQNWLVKLGKDEFTSYKVNLRRRAGTQLGGDIWGSLDARLAGDPPEEE